jgi:hypothetical protein
LGHSLGLQATRNPVEFTGMTFLRVRDGKIVEAWNNFDFATMNAQLSRSSADSERESHERADSEERG